MSEDSEERRQKDLRDLEFYRQRIRPTAADLWRTIENSRENRVIIASTPRTKPGDAQKRWSRALSFLFEMLFGNGAQNGASGPSESVGGQIDLADAIWPLVAALIVLLMLSATGMSARMPLALPL
jgi:hypothetical protein